MAHSILSRKLINLITKSDWKINKIEYHQHYKTRETIALSVYCHNSSLFSSKGWFYFHIRQLIGDTERPIQFSFTRPFRNASQMFFVAPSQITILNQGQTAEIIIHDVLDEDKERFTLRIQLVSDNADYLNELKSFVENFC